MMLSDDNKQKPEKPEDKQTGEEQESYTSISFLRMMGVPLPEGDTIEDLMDSMKKLGAKPWHPKQDGSENDKATDSSQENLEK